MKQYQEIENAIFEKYVEIQKELDEIGFGEPENLSNSQHLQNFLKMRDEDPKMYFEYYIDSKTDEKNGYHPIVMDIAEQEYTNKLEYLANTDNTIKDMNQLKKIADKAIEIAINSIENKICQETKNAWETFNEMANNFKENNNDPTQHLQDQVLKFYYNNIEQDGEKIIKNGYHKDTMKEICADKALNQIKSTIANEVMNYYGISPKEFETKDFQKFFKNGKDFYDSTATQRDFDPNQIKLDYMAMKIYKPAELMIELIDNHKIRNMAEIEYDNALTKAEKKENRAIKNEEKIEIAKTAIKSATEKINQKEQEEIKINSNIDKLNQKFKSDPEFRKKMLNNMESYEKENKNIKENKGRE